MVRLPRAFHLIALASGVSGCLLFTDPINKAPVVTFDPHPDTIYRGLATDFTVKVADEDGPASLKVRWNEFPSPDGGCDWVTAASWASLAPSGLDPRSTDAPYTFKAKSTAITCLCARVTDSQGASGQACLRVAPDNPPPKPVITDLAGASVSSPRAKCSQIQLSAAWSEFPPEDEIQFTWTLEDPKGAPALLGPCEGFTPPRQDAYQCFNAAIPGVYTVTLTITDTPPGTAASTTSPKATLAIVVQEDRPACLAQTSPELTAKWILLARSPVLGGKYESRTFTVASVKDDCEPFPGKQPSRFVWSVMDGTEGKTTWDVQANPTNASSFKVDQESFPNARPGDTIGLRVEVRDTTAELLYEVAGPVCADPSTLVCCGQGGCTGLNDCVRWTTWTVEFHP